jgi:hypothetical protein
MRFLESGRFLRSGHAPLAGGFQVFGPSVGFDMIDSLLERGVIAGIGSFGDSWAAIDRLPLYDAALQLA